MGTRARNEPGFSAELCLGGLLYADSVYTSRMILPWHQKGAPCQGLGAANFSPGRDPSWERGVPFYYDYQSPKRHSVCDLHCWKNAITMAFEKGMTYVWQKGEANLIHLEKCLKCLSNIWVPSRKTLAHSLYQIQRSIGTGICSF